jgi:hypothetical protein
MTSESSGDMTWLIEPPAAGDIHFHIGLGEGTELTPKAREALEQLLAALGAQDTHGFSAWGPDPNCPDYTVDCSPRGSCTKEFQSPCLILYRCIIAPSTLPR